MGDLFVLSRFVNPGFLNEAGVADVFSFFTPLERILYATNSTLVLVEIDLGGVEGASEDVTPCGEEHIISPIAASMLIFKSLVDGRVIGELDEVVAADECPFSVVSLHTFVEA